MITVAALILAVVTTVAVYFAIVNELGHRALRREEREQRQRRIGEHQAADNSRPHTERLTVTPLSRKSPPRAPRR